MFEPKRKYRGVICHNTEEWWHEEIGEFWPNAGKSQNLHFNGLLLTKVYNIWAKKAELKKPDEICLMTMKSDQKKN